MTATPTLLDRVRPLARIDALLTGAVAGRGGVLVVEGEPGIGKTALLADAAERGAGRGLAVLRARAGELERAYPYGVVRQLFAGVLAAAGPARRDELLSGAAGLAAAVLDPAVDHGPESAMAVEHGLHWLTAGLAGESPLLLLVDDGHWSDEPSLRWLVYLSRRLDDLAAAVVVATRPIVPGSLVGLLAADSTTDRVLPAPPGPEAVSTLVRAALGPDATDPFCTICVELTGGNPLLVTELLRAAVAAGTVPDEAGAAGLPELTSGAFGRAVLARFDTIGPEAERLARAVAVMGREAELRHAAALAGLGMDEAADAADRQVAAGLLEPGRPLRFVHPLVRAAVYAAAPAGRRAALHANAAAVLAREGRPAVESALPLR